MNNNLILWMHTVKRLFQIPSMFVCFFLLLFRRSFSKPLSTTDASSATLPLPLAQSSAPCSLHQLLEQEQLHTKEQPQPCAHRQLHPSRGSGRWSRFWQRAGQLASQQQHSPGNEVLSLSVALFRDVVCKAEPESLPFNPAFHADCSMLSNRCANREPSNKMEIPAKGKGLHL